ncbi:MAG: hypothetical protein ACI4SO_03070 [Muribaculaceae bacterium]
MAKLMFIAKLMKIFEKNQNLRGENDKKIVILQININNQLSKTIKNKNENCNSRCQRGSGTGISPGA